MMTAHISQDEVFALVFDGAVLPAAADHLLHCASCRQQVDGLRQLAADLTIARLSEPAPAVLAHYRALFAQIQQQPSMLHRAVQRVQALLTWDSRHQPALQGVRSGAANTYRQLYVADDTELELMVEQAGRLRRLEGDLIAETAAGAPALVELLDAAGALVYTAETDADGIFRLDEVAPGSYRAVITEANGAVLEIEPLEIA